MTSAVLLHGINAVSVAGCVCLSVKTPGYSTQMRPESLTAYEYPGGSAWQALFEQGLFERPQHE